MLENLIAIFCCALFVAGVLTLIVPPLYRFVGRFHMVLRWFAVLREYYYLALLCCGVVHLVIKIV